MVVKRYSNRRLYDTETSRYVTLDEIAERIAKGSNIRFVDAPTGDDITQLFLAQIILEGRGAAKLLPVPLLYRLVRLGDDALTEFFGRYVTWALDVYLRMKKGANRVAAYNPFMGVPLAATDAFARWLGGAAPWATPPPPRGAWSRGGGRDIDGPGFPAPPGYEAEGVAEPDGAYVSPRFVLDEDEDDAGVPEPPAVTAAAPASSAEVADLREELEALKRLLIERTAGDRGE
ncbi:MAG: hypothetical protein H6745_19645 [Deltaproteobacteria bacterium]|nr:hypothetical protein [Deltaproteobacteria bacterium]